MAMPGYEFFETCTNLAPNPKGRVSWERATGYVGMTSKNRAEVAQW
jgi:hypothetical protein